MEMSELERDAFARRTGITPDDLSCLDRVPLFAKFAPDDLRRLLATSSIRCYPNETTLFMADEPTDRLLVVIEGWVKLYSMCENGQEVVVTVVSRGESFAEEAIFDSSVYPYTATTVTDVRLLVVRADVILRELRENMDFTFSILSSMSQHIRVSIEQMYQLSAMPSTERLAWFLLSLCDVIRGEAKIMLPYDKSLVAAGLGMQMETFSRALGSMKRTGVNSSGRRGIIVNDVAALKATIKHNAKIPGAQSPG